MCYYSHVFIWYQQCNGYVHDISENCHGHSHAYIESQAVHVHVQVNGEQLKLTHPMSKQRKALCRSKSCSVKLRLQPVGALVRITGTAQLRSLVFCLLTTLRHIHEYGFVHRNVRLDNVIRATNGWLWIDWELAGRTNQFVWWEGKLLPHGVKYRPELYTCKQICGSLACLLR